MRSEMNEFDHQILALFKQQRERPEKSGLNGDLNADLCDAGAVLQQWRCQTQLGAGHYVGRSYAHRCGDR